MYSVITSLNCEVVLSALVGRNRTQTWYTISIANVTDSGIKMVGRYIGVKITPIVYHLSPAVLFICKWLAN